jgi:hypothetical protein
MNKHRLVLAFILSVTASLAVACNPGPPPVGVTQADHREVRLPDAFVDRVWEVASSSGVATGTLYVFLSEGTLVIASPNSKPSLGSWTFKDGQLTMVEESIPYRVDILSLDDHELAIRSHNPGSPVEIRLRLASENP